MDPVSITCSAVALTQAAGSIALSLYAFVQSLRTVDERLASLCDELRSLSRLLDAVNNTLRECRPTDVVMTEEGLWQQSELVLMDCQKTLCEMESLLSRIQGTAGERPFGWSFKRRARAAIDLNIHSSILESFRDKIQKSNRALQTILHTITVSVCLRNSASQDAILLALEQLKTSIDDALHASVLPCSHSDMRMSRNLRNLAEEAQNFHSTASSTASTIYGGSESWRNHPGTAAISLAGDLSPFKRERIEGFINGQREHYQNHDAYSTLIPVSSECEAEVESYHRCADKYGRRDLDHGVLNGDDDVELELLFVDGLEELACGHIRDGCFANAVDFLQQALQQDVKNFTRERLRRLHVLLSLSYIMQGEWRLAEPYVLQLENAQENYDLDVAGNLLHAVALGHLCAFSFDGAMTRCRQAWRIRKKLLRQGEDGNKEWDEYQCKNALGLLATIYETTGDYIRAEILWQQQPGFAYVHPTSESDYLQQCNILPNMLPDTNDYVSDHRSDCQTFDNSESSTTHDMDEDVIPQSSAEAVEEGETAVGDDGQCATSGPAPGSTVQRKESRLRVKLSQWERLENDTAKEVYVSPPDSAISRSGGFVQATLSGSSVRSKSPLQRKLTRVLRSKKVHDFGESPVLERQERHVGRNASTSPTDLTRWFSKGGSLLRKSKTLLRKRSGEDMNAERPAAAPSDPNSSADEDSSWASTLTLEDQLGWQQPTMDQSREGQPVSDARGGGNERHVKWVDSLPPMAELPDHAYVNAVSAEGLSDMSDNGDVCVPAGASLAVDAKKRQSPSRNLKEMLATSTVAGPVTISTGGNDHDRLCGTLEDSVYGPGYVADCGNDLGVEKMSLATLVLRHLDLLYVGGAREPDWLENLEVWLDDWPTTLEARFPAWGRKLGGRKKDRTRNMQESKETCGRGHSSTFMETDHGALRRSLPWTLGSGVLAHTKHNEGHSEPSEDTQDNP